MSFLNGSNYLALPRNTQKWLIRDLVPSGGLCNLYGKPKTHKSFVALAMAEAISRDNIGEWEGFDVFQHGPVCYLQVDTPRTAWGARMVDLIELQALGHNYDNVHFADMQMVPTYPFNILEPKNLQWLVDSVAEVKPVLVIIDTIREVHAGDENDSTVMRNVIGQLVSAMLPTQSAMMLLSHQKKDNAFTRAGGDDLMDDARGSSYISGRMDNIMRLTETRLTWKGRMGNGDTAVKWDEDRLSVGVDAKALQEKAMVVRIVTEERTKDPKATQAHVSRVLAKEMGKDPNTAIRAMKYWGFKLA